MLYRYLIEIILPYLFPPVVFHSSRHSSTGIKLRLNGGDIKAVQGDTSHAQSNMVTDVYSHIIDDDRKQLAQRLDEQFFTVQTTQTKTAASPSDNTSAEQLMQLLKDKPELADTLLKLSQTLSS